MARNIKKQLADYDKKVKGKDPFTVLDLFHIAEEAKKEGFIDPYEITVIALKVGYMAGYNKRKSEQRAKA